VGNQQTFEDAGARYKTRHPTREVEEGQEGPTDWKANRGKATNGVRKLPSINIDESTGISKSFGKRNGDNDQITNRLMSLRAFTDADLALP
jgi:hypothetical protein